MSRYESLTSQILLPQTLPLVLWNIISNAWKHKDIRFSQHYPREDVTSPTIVWSIDRIVPGCEGVETLKPRYRGYELDSDGLNIKEYHFQWLTIIYKFEIYANSQVNIEDLAMDFNEFAFHSIPVLKNLSQGLVHQFLFEEQSSDRELGRQSSQEIYKRTIRYRCVYNRAYVKSVDTLKQIALSFGTTATNIVKNEMLTMSSDLSNVLANKWGTEILLVQNDPWMNFPDLPPEERSVYVPNIDYSLTLDMKTGNTYIKWVENGKKPSNGSHYYITYNCTNMQKIYSTND